MSSKSSAGNYFEDFKLHQSIAHATPRTITAGDASLYTALTGSRFLLHSSTEAAKSIGYDDQLIDDILVFHIAFGKTVADISVNAVANLGYADVRFLHPVYIGDTLTVNSTVTGLRENKSGKSGIVYVHSSAQNQHGTIVLSWNRWVMVHKLDSSAPSQAAVIPELPEHVDLNTITLSEQLDFSQLDKKLTGSQAQWSDYQPGERIDHLDGMTIDNSDHTLATKLYQNNARVHFDAVHMQNSAFKQRLMYGGHIISICRALSFNGLQNALQVLAINGGKHVAPTFAGDTIYAVSEVLELIEIPGRNDVAALRLKTWGIKNIEPKQLESVYQESGTTLNKSVVLELDYTVLITR